MEAVAGAEAVAATDPVVVAAGDICGSATDCGPTAALIDQIAPTRVLTLGDNAYEDGTLERIRTSTTQTGAATRAMTSPAPGNHDYHTTNGAGYFGYFGAQAPAPVLLLRPRHLAPRSRSTAKSAIRAGSPQETWLKADLAAHPRSACSPTGTSRASRRGRSTCRLRLRPLLARPLRGRRRHRPQRPRPQLRTLRAPEPERAAPTRTGSVSSSSAPAAASHYTSGPAIANSEVRNDSAFGVLKLTLHPGSYDWRFVPVAGRRFTDFGSNTCSGAVPSPAGSSAPPYRYIYNSGPDQDSAAANGWNLLDAGSKSTADALPAGTKGLVWVGDYDNTSCDWEVPDSASPTT